MGSQSWEETPRDKTGVHHFAQSEGRCGTCPESLSGHSQARQSRLQTHGYGPAEHSGELLLQGDTVARKIPTELSFDTTVILLQTPGCFCCKTGGVKTPPFTAAHNPVVKSPGAPSASGHSRLFLIPLAYLEGAPLTENPHLPYTNCSNLLLVWVLNQMKLLLLALPIWAHKSKPLPPKQLLSPQCGIPQDCYQVTIVNSVADKRNRDGNFLHLVFG